MDWVALFEANSIEYVTKGPNTKRGELSIRCPWCGEDDPSHHMGISLTKELWGCHRSLDHRGKSPIRLLKTLLGCSTVQAKAIIAQFSTSDPGAFDSLIDEFEEPEPPKFNPVTEWTRCIDSKVFRPIKERGVTKRFFDYLDGRGFDHLNTFINMYSLKCCLSGRFKDRVIIPLFSPDKLVGWTARAIAPVIDAPRYDSTGPEVKTTIFNEGGLANTRADLLFVTEGPFDALKLDWYGQLYGARATCVFGTSMTIDQISIIRSLRKRFKCVVVLFDIDAFASSMTAEDWLFGDNIIVSQLDTIKDPGEMSHRQVRELVESHLKC